MIQPIETYYNGHRFRSRLEARWAVFFDAMGVKYQYEPEGYRKKDGTCYLPDFYLPDADAHFEVKPDTPESIPDVERAASMIELGGPIKRLVFLSDIPGPCDGGLWHFPCVYLTTSYDISPGWYFFSDVIPEGNVSAALYYPAFHLNTVKGKVTFVASPIYPLSLNAKSDRILQEKGPSPSSYWQMPRDLQLIYNAKVFSAFDKARQAHFEHGEKP